MKIFKIIFLDEKIEFSDLEHTLDQEEEPHTKELSPKIDRWSRSGLKLSGDHLIFSEFWSLKILKISKNETDSSTTLSLLETIKLKNHTDNHYLFVNSSLIAFTSDECEVSLFRISQKKIIFTEPNLWHGDLKIKDFLITKTRKMLAVYLSDEYKTFIAFMSIVPNNYPKELEYSDIPRTRFIRFDSKIVPIFSKNHTFDIFLRFDFRAGNDADGPMLLAHTKKDYI